MKKKGFGFIALIALSLSFMFPASQSFAIFFPKPPAQFECPIPPYDVLWGYVYFANEYVFPAGTEVAGFNDAGEVVFWSATLGAEGSATAGYPLSPIFGNVAEWRIYDPATMSVWAAAVTDVTNWPGYVGDKDYYRLDLARYGDEPLLITPEPATLMALGLLAASGFGFFRIKKRREE